MGVYHFGMTPLAKDFEKHGLTPTSAAKKTGLTQPEIYRWWSGERPISKQGAIKLAPLLGKTPEELMFRERTVRILGKIGAASEAHYHADSAGYIGLARFPRDGTARTVAVEVSGDSMGSGIDGWIVYYDDRRDPPTDDLLGRVCAVGLRSGQILVKILMRGRQPGCFDLFPVAAGPPLTDQIVDWAARVISMAPADLAVIEESQEGPPPAPQKRSPKRAPRPPGSTRRPK